MDELNKCLWVSGYVRRMFSRLATLPHGKLQRQQSHFARPPEPFNAYTAGDSAKRTRAQGFSWHHRPVVSREGALRPDLGLQAPRRSTPQAQIAVSRQSSPSMSPSSSCML